MAPPFHCHDRPLPPSPEPGKSSLGCNTCLIQSKPREPYWIDLERWVFYFDHCPLPQVHYYSTDIVTSYTPYRRLIESLACRLIFPSVSSLPLYLSLPPSLLSPRNTRLAWGCFSKQKGCLSLPVTPTISLTNLVAPLVSSLACLLPQPLHTPALPVQSSTKAATLRGISTWDTYSSRLNC